MRAGRLRHRVEVQAPVDVRDDVGGVTKDFETIATRWAQVSPLSAREMWASEQVDSDVTHKVRMRWTDDLTTDYRLIYDDRILNIMHPPIVKDERRVEIEVLCKENTGRG